MTKYRRNGHDVDEDEALVDGVLKDGYAIHTPIFAMDSVQRAISRNGLHDGHGGTPFHRPGYIVDASDTDADERRRQMYATYDAEKAAEYLGGGGEGSVENAVCTVRNPQYPRAQGAPGHIRRVDGKLICVPDELQRDALPARDGNMADVYAAYDARIREMWRSP